MKRGPGRPKGSKNKKNAYKLKEVKKNEYKRKKWIQVGHRRPGRPKGSKNKKKEDLSGIKIAKALGHCGKCEMGIMETDLVTRFIYLCPACHNRARVSTLNLSLNRERPTSKKEYLENTVNAQHLDTPPLLRVIEEMPDVEVVQEEEEE